MYVNLKSQNTKTKHSGSFSFISDKTNQGKKKKRLGANLERSKTSSSVACMACNACFIGVGVGSSHRPININPTFPPPTIAARRRFKAVVTENAQTETGPLFNGMGRLNMTHQAPEDQGERRQCIDDDDDDVVHEEEKNEYRLALEGADMESSSRRSFRDYMEDSIEFLRWSDGGPPRWFSPLECGSRLPASPLLLYLPDVVGIGLGLTLQNHTLGKIFDIWCLHIPVKDRTSFRGLVQLVDSTVRTEYKRSPQTPIYLVGESLGACLALAVAARNPDIDLVLVLANPATSFERSPLRRLMTPLLEAIPEQLQLSLTNFLTGDYFRTAVEDLWKGFVPLPTASLLPTEDVAAMYSFLSVLASVFTRDTLLWRLDMLMSVSAYANARLQSVKAKTLVLASGRDELLPSEDEGLRLRRVMPKCDIRLFRENGHQIFLEHGISLATIIKGASLYRLGRSLDYIRDFVPPTPSEFKKIYETVWPFIQLTSPVMLSTLQDGRVVRGLEGIPSEGPVLLVGYHMYLGADAIPMIPQVLSERNILIRGLGHPLIFKREREGMLPPISIFDKFRVMGAVPVTASNFYKLMASKSHALLYPGGVREAYHRKGEEYMLHWPEQGEFIRMAAKFGAKIVPFGTVGSDDFAEILMDYDEQMKVPLMRAMIKSMNEEVINVRSHRTGEVARQDLHFAIIMPKLPGRFYYHFGKPIETQGREQELRDKKNAHEMYLEVKSQVENSIAFLREKREADPYRNLMDRIAYQADHGPNSEIPIFDL